MVEGYTDVIAMHQCGLENVVANSGTALSVHQIKLLRRFTPNIVLLYDGDEAGIHAAMRGTDMLLKEGMNVKVLLLPDGDDPDSFSRKHTAEEFVAYIKEHQADFIAFKMNLTLQGVTDPIKRSEAISGIVRSISMIPDQITRDTYLHQCASDLMMNEETLINTMNRFIRGDIENAAKELERDQRRAERVTATQTAPQQPANTTEPSAVQTPPSPSAATLLQAGDVETLLLQTIIRHGEEIIFDRVETEDGQTIQLSVAQYIFYDLQQDGIDFSHPLYNQILREAVEHNNEEGFQAEAYFAHHHDIAISNIANQLIVNRYQLSKSLEMTHKQDSLRQKVIHLILDLRLRIINARMRDIQLQLKQAGTDMEHIRQLMEEYRDTQQLRDALARQLGSDIIVRRG